jgi:hypothetical protein
MPCLSMPWLQSIHGAVLQLRQLASCASSGPRPAPLAGSDASSSGGMPEPGARSAMGHAASLRPLGPQADAFAVPPGAALDGAVMQVVQAARDSLMSMRDKDLKLELISRSVRDALDGKVGMAGLGALTQRPTSRALIIGTTCCHAAMRTTTVATRCAVLCCAVLCCAVLCCAVLCCAVLCRAVVCCAVPCLQDPTTLSRLSTATLPAQDSLTSVAATTQAAEAAAAAAAPAAAASAAAAPAAAAGRASELSIPERLLAAETLEEVQAIVARAFVHPTGSAHGSPAAPAATAAGPDAAAAQELQAQLADAAAAADKAAADAQRRLGEAQAAHDRLQHGQQALQDALVTAQQQLEQAHAKHAALSHQQSAKVSALEAEMAAAQQRIADLMQQNAGRAAAEASLQQADGETQTPADSQPQASATCGAAGRNSSSSSSSSWQQPPGQPLALHGGLLSPAAVLQSAELDCMPEMVPSESQELGSRPAAAAEPKTQVGCGAVCGDLLHGGLPRPRQPCALERPHASF